MEIFRHLIVVVFLFTPKFSTAQKANKITFEISGGAGVSWFEYESKINRSKFTTPEFRLGTYVKKSIKENFSVLSGVLAGYKPKFYSATFPGSLTILEKVNFQDHFFFEIPLAGVYRINSFEILVGGNYRNFFPRNSSVDILSAQSEFGLLAGINYHIIKKVGISFKYLNGLKGFPYTSTSGSTIRQTQWNRSAYLMASYRL